jgi:hypothetical protein
VESDGTYWTDEEGLVRYWNVAKMGVSSPVHLFLTSGSPSEGGHLCFSIEGVL